MSEVEGLFLKVGELKNWTIFPKFQDIDRSNFVSGGLARSEESVQFPLLGQRTVKSNFQESGVVHFVSHRWLSETHPDPHGEQLRELTSQLPEDALIWYDYACLPQDPRTTLEDDQVRQALQGLPQLVKTCWFVILGADTDGYQSRAWCQFEAVSALLYNSRPPTRFYGDHPKSYSELPKRTEAILAQSPLYRALLDCIEALPKDRESVEKSDDIYLRGYYIDIPDLEDDAFSKFKSAFFALQSLVPTDPPVLWEILRSLFPARQGDYTYRSS